MGGGEGEEAVEEAVEEERRAGDGFWQGEGKECGEGFGSHGGEIAEAAGQGAMADGSGVVPGAAEVAVFEGEVGGDEELVMGGWFEDGAVVADAEADAVGGLGAGADAVDDAQLAPGFLHRAAVRGIRHRFQSKSTRRRAVGK